MVNFGLNNEILCHVIYGDLDTDDMRWKSKYSTN